MLLFLTLACESAEAPASASAARLVRLTHSQWERTTADLLGLTEPTGFSEGFVPDATTATFDNDAEGLTVSDTLWQQYQSAAESLAERVVGDNALYAALVPAPRTSPEAGWAERDAWLASFGRRAFRRPLTGAELESFKAIFERGAAAYDSGDAFADGVRASLVAFLQSPDFVYRVEGLDAAVHQTELDDWALAARLSYGLWNTMPDEALFEAAEAGFTEATLTEQVARLLAAPEAHDTFQDLHRQLLHVDSYRNIPREFVSYEDYSLTESGAMEAEVYAFTDHVLFGGGTIAELFTSRETFVDAQVAALYGIHGVEGVGADALTPVQLDPTQRAGLLTMPGFLKWEASETEENLIRRGAFVNETFLCASLPPPPSTATPLPEPEPGASLRERIEAHTSGCGGSCHNDLINPVGYAFGNYDENGEWQTYEVPALVGGLFGDAPIDASAAYTFEDGVVPFQNAVELAEVMAARPEVHRCYASHLLAWLESRTPDGEDEARIEALAEASMEGRSVLGLVSDIVTDPAFRGLAATE